MTGFGAAMVAVPILAQFMPLSVAVPLVVLFDLACTALVGGRNWRQVSRVELARLFPWMLLGIFLGVTLLRNAGARWPLIVLGCFVLTVCARGLKGGRGASQEPLPTPWALPFGVFGGVFSALFGTGGPIYTIYLSRRIAALDAFRATISVVILASGVVRAGAFAAAGLYTQPAMLKALPCCCPWRWPGCTPDRASGRGWRRPAAAVHLPAAGGGWRGGDLSRVDVAGVMALAWRGRRVRHAVMSVVWGTGGGIAPPAHEAYFAVGMANSAPLAMLSGQRCMMDFCLV